MPTRHVVFRLTGLRRRSYYRTFPWQLRSFRKPPARLDPVEDRRIWGSGESQTRQTKRVSCQISGRRRGRLLGTRRFSAHLESVSRLPGHSQPPGRGHLPALSLDRGRARRWHACGRNRRQFAGAVGRRDWPRASWSQHQSHDSRYLFRASRLRESGEPRACHALIQGPKVLTDAICSSPLFGFSSPITVTFRAAKASAAC